MLEGETNEVGRFERLAELLSAHHGVRSAHLRRDAGVPELCVHYDEANLPASEVLRLARVAGSQAGRRYLSKMWLVNDMESAQCAMVIEHALNRMPGILEAHLAYASERLVVEFDSEITSPDQIERRMEALGYALESPEPGHVCSHHAHGGGLAPKLELPLSIAGGVLTALGFVLERAQLAPPAVATACFAAAIASGGYFACRGALRSLAQLRVDIESLMVLAALGAAALGAWFEGAFLLFLFSLGHAIEHRAMDRARRAVEALHDRRPAVAYLKRADHVSEVPVSKLVVGDQIVVRPGDRVPVDGRIVQGEGTLDQAALTGESAPALKKIGDEIYCGSINGDGALEVEVLRPASASMLSKMIDLVVAAEARQGPSQRFARKLEQRVVPWVLALAVAMPFVFALMGLTLKEALLRSVALLVAASPCALAISTPAAVLSAVARAAREGVVLKGGAYLEALARVEAIAFDKTGTLTEGKPRVTSVVPAAGITEHELLAVAAGLELLSSHPLARAILQAAAERGVEPKAADTSVMVQGKGVRGTCAGEALALGNLALFEGLSVPTFIKDTVDNLERAGHTTCVVERGGRFLGVLGVSDAVRPAAPHVIRSLKRHGVMKTLMLSGDNERVAKAVGTAVGLDDVRAPLLPEGKLRVLRTLARTRRGVAMVGDGVNDAPALAAASVGIAMGGVGSDVALETADVVLMGDDLNKLSFALLLAQRSTRVIRQNLVISLGVAATLIVCSVLGIASVAESVIFHEGSTLLVVANGLALLRFRAPRTP